MLASAGVLEYVLTEPLIGVFVVTNRMEEGLEEMDERCMILNAKVRRSAQNARKEGV